MFVKVLPFNARCVVNCLPMSLFFKMAKRNIVLLGPNNFIFKILIFNGTFWKNSCNGILQFFF